MSMKTLPKSYNARVNLCSLKKKIGEPAGTNKRQFSLIVACAYLAPITFIFSYTFLFMFFKFLAKYYLCILNSGIM